MSHSLPLPRICGVIVSLLVNCNLWANTNFLDFVDVYGASPAHQKYILNHYANAVYTIEKKINLLIKNQTDLTQVDLDQNRQYLAYAKEKTNLKNKIKQKLQLAFVNFDNITYEEGVNYVTIEVIEKNDLDRLHLITQDKQTSYVSPRKKDVFDDMIEYNLLSASLFMSQKIQSTSEDCPVYHCTFGFKHPTQAPYLSRFNQSVRRQKPLILSTLKHDPSSERRAAAVYLVGHFKNPQEIIETLLPFVNVPNTLIRNNALRVIGETMYRSHYTDIDVRPFLKLLLSPYETDRNKSLLVLLSAADAPMQKQVIRELGEPTLKLLAQLKQPNNRLIAEQVLRKITIDSTAPILQN
jgi:hypothetical protein